MTPEHTQKVFWCNWLHSTESELSSRSNETSLLKCVTLSWELLLGQWAWIWGPWWQRNTLLLATTINQGKESVGQHQKASNPSSRFKYCTRIQSLGSPRDSQHELSYHLETSENVPSSWIHEGSCCWTIFLFEICSVGSRIVYDSILTSSIML